MILFVFLILNSKIIVFVNNKARYQLEILQLI